MKVTFTNMITMLSQDMTQRVQDMDVLSNNLANVNTTAYKSSRSNFQELLGEETRKSGSLINSTQMITTQGAAVNSGRELDLFISGDGYLQVELPDGQTAYTRDSRLFLDADRQLVNSSGNKVVWDGTIPEEVIDSQLLITEDGDIMRVIEKTEVSTQIVQDENGNEVEQPIMYTYEDENGEMVETELLKQVTTTEKIGSLNLARFTNPSALTSYGSNLYLANDNTGDPQVGTPGTENFGTLIAQRYEGSNVNLAEELTHLISIQRGLQLSARTYKGVDQMIQQTLQMAS